MKKVLHYIPAFEIGGIESLFLNIVESSELKRVKFDLLCETKLSEEIKKKLRAKNVEIFEIISPKKNIFRHVFKIVKICNKKNYEIVHIHSFYSRPFVSIISKLRGIKKIILHAHSISFDDKKFFLLKKFINKISVLLANEFLACSKEAGKFMFGDSINFEIIPNGIDTEKYKFDIKTREKYREDFKLDKDIVIGHIGRFTYAKNQSFIIDIVKYLSIKIPNLKLILVGDGGDFSKIKNKVKKQGVEDNVIFAGNRNDISQILSMMDIFIMPSFFEGLSLVLLEVQASGLSAIVSDVINDDNIILPNIRRISLNTTVEIWGDTIIDLVKNNFLDKRIYMNKIVEKSNYSIRKTVKKLEKIYLK